MEIVRWTNAEISLKRRDAMTGATFRDTDEDEIRALFGLLKRKHGVRHEKDYRRNQIKKCKVTGESHRNWKERYVPGRNDPDFIALNCCGKNCLNKIDTKEELDDDLISFYSMGSKNEQDKHLQKLIELKSVERKRGRESTLITTRKPKLKTVQYYLLLNRKRIKVCKKAFINAHNVTPKRICRIANLLEKGEIPQDKRGKHPCATAISAEVCEKIHKHIASFAAKASHYTSDTRYNSSADLSVREMHRLFTQKYPEMDVKYQFYWQYFRANFSLSFGRPVVEACSQCESLKAK
ncbi:unnamed protein product [Pieris macdunnoughi]|uniref:Uncharacterized protein n=1 Tax=Pieris macdunnoughi TaxID=345717 RepID=A0A821UHA6_9NEOP|nr:unnamed protein product [Pieris macdunnoughi]